MLLSCFNAFSEENYHIVMIVNGDTISDNERLVLEDGDTLACILVNDEGRIYEIPAEVRKYRSWAISSENTFSMGLGRGYTPIQDSIYAQVKYVITPQLLDTNWFMSARKPIVDSDGERYEYFKIIFSMLRSPSDMNPVIYTSQNESYFHVLPLAPKISATIIGEQYNEWDILCYKTVIKAYTPPHTQCMIEYNCDDLWYWIIFQDETWYDEWREVCDTFLLDVPQEYSSVRIGVQGAYHWGVFASANLMHSTAVESLPAGQLADVSIEGSTLHIDCHGDPGQVTLYELSGHRLYKNENVRSTSLEHPTGIYILKILNNHKQIQTTKICIK